MKYVLILPLIFCVGCTATEGRAVGEAFGHIAGQLAALEQGDDETQAILGGIATNAAAQGEAIGSAVEGEVPWWQVIAGLATSAVAAYGLYAKGHKRGEYHAEVKRVVTNGGDTA